MRCLIMVVWFVMMQMLAWPVRGWSRRVSTSARRRRVRGQGEEEGVVRTFSTHDGADVCPSSRLGHLAQPLLGDRVPLALALDDAKVAPDLEVERVVRALLDVLVLARDLA